MEWTSYGNSEEGNRNSRAKPRRETDAISKREKRTDGWSWSYVIWEDGQKSMNPADVQIAKRNIPLVLPSALFPLVRWPPGIQGVLFIGATRDAVSPNRSMAIKLILRAKRRWDRWKRSRNRWRMGGTREEEKRRGRRKERGWTTPRVTSTILLTPSSFPFDHPTFFSYAFYTHVHSSTYIGTFERFVLSLRFIRLMDLQLPFLFPFVSLANARIWCSAPAALEIP